MFQYYAYLLFAPMHWVWDNILNKDIYGITLWQVAVMFICISVFFRMFIIPTIGGQKFSASMPYTRSSVGTRHIKTIGNNYKMDVDDL